MQNKGLVKLFAFLFGLVSIFFGQLFLYQNISEQYVDQMSVHEEMGPDPV